MAIEFGEKKNDVVQVFRGKTFSGYIIVLPDDVIFNGNSIEEIEQVLAKMKELKGEVKDVISN